MKPCLVTRTGKIVDILNPDPDSFTLFDIAHGLARAMRWGNQSDMSVAQHSVNVAWVVEQLGGTLPQQRSALFHDASEFLIADIPSPLKQLLPAYYDIENRLMTAIASKFFFEWPVPEIVAVADKMMLVTEAFKFMHRSAHHCISPEYGFPADAERFKVPYWGWAHEPLCAYDAADLWLRHEERLAI